MAITDLTNTKWYFNEHPTLMSYKTYYINFYSKERGNCNDICIMSYEIDYSGSIVYESNEWSSEWDRTIEITGGTDVKNTSLISWLTSNATQIVEETPPTKIKSPCVVIQTKVKQVVIDNTNMTIDVYTNGVPKELISFTVGGVSYQCEENMTWKQWCASEYNTKGAYISLGNGVNTVHWEDYSVTYFYAVSKGDGTVVNESDIIISNYSYSQKRVAHSGGGSD